MQGNAPWGSLYPNMAPVGVEGMQTYERHIIDKDGDNSEWFTSNRMPAIQAEEHARAVIKPKSCCECF
jgi:hypothetical protein